ncbi:MAG: DUF72 domain-containing protein [Candidatus Cloacimonetes bacterium]|nr:DUF72 domain-containing protein [Candidatus Cloacimonadota bacterium]
MILKEKIRIGTSGYSFADWKGDFYPANLKQNEYLDYYQKYFDTVELNFSYYGIPKNENLLNLEELVSDTFAFFIKAYKSLTHFYPLKLDKTAVFNDLKTFRDALKNTAKIKGILFQFPFDFKYTNANLAFILELATELSDYRIIWEFRHESWLNYSVSNVMKEKKISYCCVDEPQLPGLIPPIVRVFNDTAYLRFHGRNKTNWWKNQRDLRYDYLYTSEELDEWMNKIQYLTAEAEMVYIFFNNCHLGKAVKNAKMLQKKLTEIELHNETGIL